MFSNRLAFVALSVACIAAAAGGGYLASHQNAVPTPAAAQVAATQPAPTTPRRAPRKYQKATSMSTRYVSENSQLARPL